MRSDIYQLTDFLRQNGIVNSDINTFAEIGSRDGHDSDYIKKFWDLKNQDVYIFEAHPECYKSIRSRYPLYKSYNVAVTNKTGIVGFNAGVVGKEPNVGISSLLERSNNPDFIYDRIEVDGWALDDIVTTLNLPKLDIIKIDVEGATKQVLSGFEKNIINTKFIQIELETEIVWDNQTIYNEIVDLMSLYGFDVVNDVVISNNQKDTLFKNKSYII